VPAWEQYPWLRAGFSTRQGGRTTAYGLGDVGELNLGWTKEDDPEIVAANRRSFLAAVAGQAGKQAFRSAQDARLDLVTLLQCHGATVHVIRENEASGQPAAPSPDALPTAWSAADGRAVLRGDGAMTRRPGWMLGVQTADCVPVLVADTRTRAVAAFHAGWRGTLARIVEHGIARMQMEFGSRPQDLVAAIGPAIRPCCFAVGREVKDQFEGQFGYAPALFSEVSVSAPAPGHAGRERQIHLDLHEANRRQLLDAGLNANDIRVLAECTACARLGNGRRKYFSHRAEHGVTGRMLSVVGTL
jgi:YfiH family protein